MPVTIPVSLSEAILRVTLTGVPCSTGFRAPSAAPSERAVLPLAIVPSAVLVVACPFPLAANCTESASVASPSTTPMLFPLPAPAVTEGSSFPVIVPIPALDSAVIVSSLAICPAHIVI
ncbi:hypothetical protein D3C78_1288390 [compost metagenome]